MQGTFFDTFDAEPDDPDSPPPTIDDRFRAFDAACPEVYRLFVRFAEEVRRAGHERFSADALLHRCRWERAIASPKDGGFKINNIFSSRYARKLMAERPEFQSFFETRKLRSAGGGA